MTVIRTARLTLRPFVESDIDAVVALLNDWEVSQWLAAPPFPYRRADARFYVDHVRANHEAGAATEFAIAVTDGDAVAGSIGLKRTCGDAESAALGYWLGQPHWGHGYASEAAAAGRGLWFRRIGAPADQGRNRSGERTVGPCADENWFPSVGAALRRGGAVL